MSKLNKFVLPKIPGRIYSKTYTEKYFLFLGIPIFLYFSIPMLMDPKISSVMFMKISGMYAVAIFMLVINVFSKSRTVATDVTEMSVSAKFTNNRNEIKSDPLENYKLLLNKVDMSRSYRYGVSLVRIDEKKQPKIVLADAIFCPIKLKEWVESFQSQIAKPLPIVFSSPEIESDYNTGVYMSLKKKP